jgi:protein-disulfide isomerase
LAGCDSSKFLAIHDEIFQHQKNLDDDFLKALEEKHSLKDCQSNQTTKDFVAKSIQSGDKLGINSTPTLFVNGRKIEGSIPNEQFYAILIPC